MTWPTHEARRLAIKNQLATHSQNVEALPGIGTVATLETLSLQIIASLRREEYFRIIQQRGPVLAYRANPNDARFEAELGAVYNLQAGDIDEASWLIFLMTAFGKPANTGWERLRDVYGMLGAGTLDWQSVSAQPNLAETWLAANWQSVGGGPGSHRKYESMRPNTQRPIGAALTQYVNWINDGGGHANKFASLVQAAGNSPEAIFDHFYNELPCRGFARLGKFDWVSMLARYGLVTATPGTAYLRGATGPLRGASLLFRDNVDAPNSAIDGLQDKLTRLDADLNVGMSVLEDSLCNWQKNPTNFVHFKG